MNVALHRPMTVDEFLAWEEAQKDRWEFDGFAPVAMVGGTSAHALIVGNVHAQLWNRLRGQPCKPFLEGLKIRPANSVRYPDVFVHCAPIANTATIAQNPVVVVEVLSPSIASTDIVVKNREYAATPSSQRYIMVLQDSIGATVFERRGDNWVGSLVTDPDAPLEMPEIGVSFPLRDCYEGLIEPA